MEVLTIYPKMNLLRLIGGIAFIPIIILLWIDALLNSMPTGEYFLLLMVTTIGILSYNLYSFSSILGRRIILTPEEIINNQELFLKTWRISKNAVANCRIQINELADGAMREKILVLIGKQGEIVGEINVSDFAADDVEQLVTILKGGHGASKVLRRVHE